MPTTRTRGPDVGQQPQQRLGEQPRAGRDRVVLVARLVGSAAPLVAGRRHLDAHRGAAVDADDQHAAPRRQVDADLVRDRPRQALAVRAEGRRVVLLAHRPEPACAGERQLGARHLADRAAVLAQHLDDGRVDPGATGALVHLGVRVEQAVGQVADAVTAAPARSCRRAGARPCRRAPRPPPQRERAVDRHRDPARRAPSAAASRISSGVATRKPRIRWPWRNSSTMSSGTTSPACAPHVTSRPSARHRRHVLAEQRPTGGVDHRVDAAAVGRLAHRLADRRLAVAEDDVGAQRAHRPRPSRARRPRRSRGRRRSRAACTAAPATPPEADGTSTVSPGAHVRDRR